MNKSQAPAAAGPPRPGLGRFDLGIDDPAVGSTVGTFAARSILSPEMIVRGSGTAGADPEAVRRILRNLLENARRHAEHRVQVAVRSGSVTVTDDGAGVPAADRERIFDRFTRLDDARTRSSGGSGLGLPIARELARAAGGDLTVDGAGAGGASFRLTLPDG